MSESADWIDHAKSRHIPTSLSVPVEQKGIVLIAGRDSAVSGNISVQVGIGTAEQPTCVVATTVPSAKLAAYIADQTPSHPALGFVDATATRPNPAVKQELQAIEDIPSARDLLQLTTAISDVRETIAPDEQPANIVIPSFDGLLGVAPTDRVVRVLSHIAAVNGGDGSVHIGLDYTAGSEDTFQTLKSHSDVLLWAEQEWDGSLELVAESHRV